MIPPSASSPSLHVLIIAVDYYLPGSFGGVAYPSLQGCVRDAGLVEDFVHRLGVAPERISKLTSTNPVAGQPGPVEPPEARPTYRNMVQAFRRLAAAAHPGDQVYVHYSGHGGRTKTLWPELKPDGLDEALVPMDISSPSAQYLRDLELAHLLQELVDKGLFVTLVLDSCHSGGATRGIVPSGEHLSVRGVSFVDDTPRPAGSLVASPGALAATWRKQDGRATRNLTAATGWLPAPDDYVLLAACRPHELAYEFAFAGKERNGALTYWLLDALRGLRPGMTYRMVYDRVLARVHGQFERQTPLVLGPADRLVFGIDRRPSQPGFLVMKVDVGGKRVLLQPGQAAGVRKGARFAIYPQGMDPADPARRTALAEVTGIGASDAWADVLESFGTGKIEPGDTAVLLGAAKLRRLVRLVPRTAESGAAEKGALDRIRQALPPEGEGWVAEVQPGQEADFCVSLSRSGGEDVYVIGDAAGLPLPNLRPAVRVADPGAAGAVVRRLEHLARYRAVAEIENHDEDSPLASQLVIELLGRQRDYDPADKPEPEPFPDGGLPELDTGEWVFLRIRNESGTALNVAALNLQPDWGISQVFPSRKDASFEALEPGKERLLKLRAGLPEGCAEGTDVLKVWATVGAADFRILELPALDQPPRMRGTREQARSRAGPSRLDLLLGTLATEKPTRTLTPGSSPSEEWTAVQVAFRVRRANGRDHGESEPA
ncbi:MAG TPA: caspase family protein [Thermoanaerobaculia bacterium]|nr:caspase family protein [Thermoanaerobaculia bacterium]